MFRMLIAVLILAIASTAFAQTQLDTKGLTPEQVQQLQTQANNMKQGTTTEKAREWVEIGEMVGKAFGSTAKELNVQVNDFAKTPVGKTAMFLIVWKFFGREMMHYVGGVGLFCILMPIWWYMFKRLVLIESIEWETVDGKKRKKRVIYQGDWDNPRVGWSVAMICMFVAIMMASMITFWS